MSDISCNICLANFCSSDEFDNHKEKCVCNNDSSPSSSSSKTNSNLSILKTNNSLNNESDLMGLSKEKGNKTDEKKKSKLLKEIGDCSFDLSSVNGRTRNRNSVNGNSGEKINAKGKIIDNKNDIDKDNRDKNSNKSSSKGNSVVSGHSGNDKENSFVKIPTKIEKKSVNKVNTINEYLSTAPVFRDRLGLKLNDGDINKRLESMNTFLERESENRCFVTVNCDFQYDSRESLINHIKRVHHLSKPITLNSIEKEEKKKNENNSSENEKVEETNFDRTDEDDIKAKKSNKLSFVCKDCPEEFETFNQLKTHLLIHRYDSSQNNGSTPSSTVESESVTDNISTSETLSENIQVSPNPRSSRKRKRPYSDLPVLTDFDEPPKKSLKCNDCLRTFMRQSNYKVHRKNYHDNPNPKPLKTKIKCDQCSKEFASTNLLKVHKSAYCFKSVAELQEWLSANIGPQYQFGCGICGMALKTSKKLEQHKQEAHAKFQMPIRKISNLN